VLFSPQLVARCRAAIVSAGASFATFDSATLSSVTLSGGDLVATNTGTTSNNQGAHVASASGKSSGKYYFEVTLTTFVAGSGVGAGVGTAATSYGTQSAFPNGAHCLAVGFGGSGNIDTSGGNSGFSLGALASGDVICVAVDFTNSRIWFRKGAAGLWNNASGHDPTIGNGTGGGVTFTPASLVPFVTYGTHGFGGQAGQSGNVMTANFGATAFVGTVPSGYTSGWPA
jgi:hypothetical protein